jgi:hypothetical protein
MFAAGFFSAQVAPARTSISSDDKFNISMEKEIIPTNVAAYHCSLNSSVSWPKYRRASKRGVKRDGFDPLFLE